MIDYRGLEALYAVIELQSFEDAAKKLRVTQSAISQRIKSLEAHYGEPLLVRILPYKPTVLGKKLIAHFTRLMLLEEDLDQQLGASVLPRFSIALNRDSLETWFLEAIQKSKTCKEILLEVIADDQELTIDYLKNGQVCACVSTSAKEIVGGKVKYLGVMEYVLVATSDFIKTYSLPENLRKAPGLKFDQKDTLHERYLETCFKIQDKELPVHILPSVKGFKQFVLSGNGYGLLPRIDIEKELKNGQIRIIEGSKPWEIPLYWHYWMIDTALYRSFNAEIIQYAKTKLKTHY